MKTATVAEAKSQLSAILKATKVGPVVVTSNGRPVAVIVGVQDEDQAERLCTAYSPRLQEIVAKSRQQIRDGEVLGHEEFWAEVEASRKRRPRKKRKAAPVKN